MIRVYSTKTNEFYTDVINSQSELDDLSGKVDWLWIDCLDLDESETTIISKSLGIEAKTLSEIEEGKVRPSYEKCFDESCPYYTWISTPFVEFKDELKMHPMSMILKDGFLITLHDGHSLRLTESTMRTFRDLVAEGKTVKSGFIVGKLLHELIDENSSAIVSIRELIDKLEGQALENPREKATTQSVFKLKGWLSTLHRLLWVEQELLSDMGEEVVPRMKLSKEAKTIVSDAMDDVDRQLNFVDSNNRSLDSVLRLQESARSLGLIHGVEKTLVFLTLALLVLTVGLMILDLMAALGR